jgi:haloacetate dehalogenase
MSENKLSTRRGLLQETAFAAGALALARKGSAQSGDASSPPAWKHMFPAGFRNERIKTSGAEINAVIGGSGPPVLLFHGAPQSLITWRLIAPDLAKEYTLVLCDLRGYGDSSKPPDGENHSNYSKRPMALDGLDIVPAHYLYSHVTLDFVRAYFHWFNYLRPPHGPNGQPGPEDELLTANQERLKRATSDVEKEYLRTSATPENIHAMCEDYRASASIDLKIDAADIQAGKKIQCPLHTLWAANGAMGRLYDVLAIWKEEGIQVSGKGLPGNHSLQESAPKETLAELQQFLRG